MPLGKYEQAAAVSRLINLENLAFMYEVERLWNIISCSKAVLEH